MGARHYEVDPVLCTECLGYYDKPTCIEVCPIDCVTLVAEGFEEYSA